MAKKNIRHTVSHLNTTKQTQNYRGVILIVAAALFGLITSATHTLSLYSPDRNMSPSDACSVPSKDDILPQSDTVCGDGVCEGEEDSESCPKDCDEPPPSGPECGNGVCEDGEDSSNCPMDCDEPPPPEPECGNGECEGDENFRNCPKDCGEPPPSGPECGNGTCEDGEDHDNCPKDCGEPPPPDPVCGDGKCEDGEDYDNCPEDCGTPPPPDPECGNSVCESGEDADSCLKDCGPPPPICGNGVCESGENADTCFNDCEEEWHPPEPCREITFGDLSPQVQSAYQAVGQEMTGITNTWLVCDSLPEELCIPLTAEEIQEISDEDALGILECASNGGCQIFKLKSFEVSLACATVELLTCDEGCTLAMQVQLPSESENAGPNWVLILSIGATLFIGLFIFLRNKIPIS